MWGLGDDTGTATLAAPVETPPATEEGALVDQQRSSTRLVGQAYFVSGAQLGDPDQSDEAYAESVRALAEWVEQHLATQRAAEQKAADQQAKPPTHQW